MSKITKLSDFRAAKRDRQAQRSKDRSTKRLVRAAWGALIMRTQINVELDDETRNRLAVLVDGKPSKRLLTRKEVVEITEEFWLALSNPEPLLVVEEEAGDPEPPLVLTGRALTWEDYEAQQEAPAAPARAPAKPRKASSGHAYIDAKVAEMRAAGKSEDWITGWTRGALKVVQGRTSAS